MPSSRSSAGQSRGSSAPQFPAAAGECGGARAGTRWPATGAAAVRAPRTAPLGRAPVRDDGQVGVIQGKGALVFFSLTEQVNGGVDRQPVQPGGKRCLPLKGRQSLPSLEESGLGHFFRVVVAPCFAQGQVVDHLLVALHQAGEGILVSLPGQGHQLPSSIVACIFQLPLDAGGDPIDVGQGGDFGDFAFPVPGIGDPFQIPGIVFPGPPDRRFSRSCTGRPVQTDARRCRTAGTGEGGEEWAARLWRPGLAGRSRGCRRHPGQS